MIEKTVLLPCPPPRAFTLFTEQASAWWPPSRRHTGDPNSAITMLPNGRFYERAHDGKVVDLGHVTRWEPPHRVELDFFVGTDAEHPTQVSITFSPVDDGTLVTVIHCPTPISQELWTRRAPLFGTSWDLVLAALVNAAC